VNLENIPYKRSEEVERAEDLRGEVREEGAGGRGR
jgi:hypothetical protein